MTLTKAIESIYVLYQNWEPVSYTTPSGKFLWRCNVCEVEDPAPCKYPYHDCRKQFKEMLCGV